MTKDVIVIGGGVIGCNILYELAKKNVNALLLEAQNDVSCGASRANSGIVHAGYDCKPNTLKARFNVEGSKMYENLCKELDVPYENVGSLVVAEESGLEHLKKLKEFGDKNGVPTEVINREQILAIEPNVSDNICYALNAPTASVVSPYKLTIALADFAVLNGAEIELNSKVVDISYDLTSKIYTVTCENGKEYKSKLVINCAGTHSMEINKIAGVETYETEFRRGEYFVLDQTERAKLKTVLFPLPDEGGKGVLVVPTADGNVLYGPTSLVTGDADDNSITEEGLDFIKKNIARIYKPYNLRKVIRVFSGLRSGSGNDFIIKKSEVLDNYIMLLGICSPGLSSAPAIAKYVVGELVSSLVDLEDKEEIKSLPKHLRFNELSKEELNELIKKDSKWGRIICRCEKVTEAEIVNAIHSPLKATTVDAIKRRTRAGMGRCQGGFCAPRVMEILSRELDIPFEEIKLNNEGSEIALSEIKA